MKIFDAFEEMSREDIQETLIEHLQNARERQRQIVLAMQTDSRSRGLKNRAREQGAVLAELNDILDELGIDPCEID